MSASKKTHLLDDTRLPYARQIIAKCGRVGPATRDIAKVTCKNCLRTLR